MSKRMLIEATHSEETRVVVLDDTRLEELDVETSTKKQIKGNIYLAKIIRVEPSLQAAFVDYGGNRHGFLAFSEIHPDYYQIPVADKQALKEEMIALAQAEEEARAAAQQEQQTEASEDEDEVETVSGSDNDDVSRPRYSSLKKYKIQEVIHHGQIVLVQVIKEERGNKGAALTTYLSLAGRYSVLMPNNGNGGGVSRKISNAQDRHRLKDIVESLPIPEGMAVIIRTAGREKTKSEIKKDYEYLIKTWAQILDKTKKSFAPELIHEEGNLIKRSLRDVFTDEIDEVIMEGADNFKATKAFMKSLMPKQVKKLKEYTGKVPLFTQYGIEEQIEEMNNKNVYLKSGGYIVIDQTEALVAIDVNSGRATRERNIEETALKTNLEAAEEVARQLRLRDLAGLVVIDFIDMDEQRNNHAVERKMKEALKSDRARVQMGKITGFGLMEISRQRLRSSFLESGHHVCPMCQGRGIIRSEQSCAMHALHLLEDAALKNPNNDIVLTLPPQIAFYILNNKRDNIAQIEKRYDLTVKVEGDGSLQGPTDFRLERLSKHGKVFESVTGQSVSDQAPNAVAGKRDKRKKDSWHSKAIDFAGKIVDFASAAISGSDMEEKNHADAPKPHEERKEKNVPAQKREKQKKQAISSQKAPEGEEKFKVVHQEAMIVFDSHQATTTPQKSKEENNPSKQDASNTGKKKKKAGQEKQPTEKSVKNQKPSPKEEKKDIETEVVLEQKNEKISDVADKTTEQPTEEKPKTARKGWWNQE